MSATPASRHSESMEWLRAGNARFVAGESAHRGQTASDLAALAGGQSPRVAVFGCGDSRAIPELVFDAGFGEIFTVRTAGHVLGTAALASLEFAVAELGVDTIVLLGHEACGAVAASAAYLDGAPTLPGHMQEFPNYIAPHIKSAWADGHLAEAPADNARATVPTLEQESSIIAEAVIAGTLTLVPAVLSLKTGVVEFV